MFATILLCFRGWFAVSLHWVLLDIESIQYLQEPERKFNKPKSLKL